MTRRAPRGRDDEGAVAVLMAVSMALFLVVVAMVIDFGLIRVDRQVDKSAADAATIAGLHALNTGDTKAHPAVGVCTALRFLRENGARFAAVTSASGSWKSGTNVTLANGCTDDSLRTKVCKPGDLSTWVKYMWAGTWSGVPLTVTIQSGYAIPLGAPAPPGEPSWSEDALAAAQADTEDNAQGCNQLAVVITQHRQPGFGSLATSSDLVTSIRSVGRIKIGPGGYAPAMLLLKRTGCPVLAVGASGGGASSWIHVRGAVSSNGRAQPGTIHSDSDGTGCSNSIFAGKANDGIVTYAAPLVSNAAAADSTKPGSITSVAGANGVGIGTVRDAAASVYGSSALNESGAGAAAKADPSGRSMITRQPVDDRYMPVVGGGVRAIVSNAQASVFGLLTPANAVSNGYVKVTCSGGSVASLPALTSSSKLYVDCANLKSIPVVNAGTVVFSGQLSPSTSLSLPNATKVYIFGGSDAISLGTGNEFHMHTAGNTAAGTCTNTAVPANKAILVIKGGGIKQTGGALQLCRTTMVMMGGSPDGCVPSTNGAAPTQSPCGVGGMGSGQIAQNGGTVDWTAPNTFDAMTMANGDDDPAKSPAWTDPLGPEDLAFWSESAANSGSTKASMGGGALLHVSGVFMTPNYEPFTIGGNGMQDLKDAQYISTSVALNGAVQLNMEVDPNAAVPLPKLKVVGLVR